MSKRPLTKTERFHRAFGAGTGSFAVLVLGYKFGYRGKYHSADDLASWSDVGANLPSFVVLSLLASGIVYFWLGRRNA